MTDVLIWVYRTCRNWCKHGMLNVVMCVAQIHLHKNGDVRIFSRNCEERTSSFPDVADAVRSAAAGATLLHRIT